MRVWLYFLHHTAKVSLGAVLLLMVALLPLGFAIGTKTMILSLSAAQYPAETSSPVGVASVPSGVLVQPVELSSFSTAYPLIADLHTYVIIIHNRCVLLVGYYVCVCCVDGLPLAASRPPVLLIICPLSDQCTYRHPFRVFGYCLPVDKMQHCAFVGVRARVLAQVCVCVCVCGQVGGRVGGVVVVVA